VLAEPVAVAVPLLLALVVDEPSVVELALTAAPVSADTEIPVLFWQSALYCAEDKAVLVKVMSAHYVVSASANESGDGSILRCTVLH